MSTASATRSPQKLIRFIWPVVLGALLVAMAMDTTFLSTEEAAATKSAEFDATTFVSDEYPKIVQAIETNSTDLEEVVAAVAADPAAAGETFGHVAGTDKHAIPVRFTGKVSETDAAFLTIDVAGLPEGSVVRVALGQAVNGTALRAAPGTIKFEDFQNQTDYQQVANELKSMTLEQVAGKVDAASWKAKSVSVVGVYVTNTGPEDSYLVTPVTIEAVN
ncbi:MAG: DUF2291 family protein [Pseudonocardiaceae bacterium]